MKKILTLFFSLFALMAAAQTVVITQAGTGSGIDTSYQLGDSIYIVAGGTDTIFTGVATSGGGGGSGTVTSVAATVPTGFSVTGSPITSSGTLAITNNLTSGVVKSSGVGLSFTSGLVDIITETTGTLTPARGGTGLTGLGTANQLLRVNAGATGLEYFSATFPTGGGAAGQVTYWTGASTQSGSNNLFWDASNNRLGIGTASPSVSLHVKGGFYVDNAAVGLTHRNVAGNIRMFTNLTSDNGEFYLRNSADANTVLVNSAGASYFNGGNVGIGTATPAATTKLDVVAASTTNASGTATSAIHNVSLSSSSSAVYKGGYYDVRTNAHAQSMSGGKLIGLDGYALFQGTQTLSEATGIKGVIQTNNGGTITEGIGIKAEVITSGGGVVTNAYGITVPTVNGTNTWGIYAAAGAKNYFAGNLGIGVSSPTNKIDALGTVADAANATAFNFTGTHTTGTGSGKALATFTATAAGTGSDNQTALKNLITGGAPAISYASTNTNGCTGTYNIGLSNGASGSGGANNIGLFNFASGGTINVGVAAALSNNISWATPSSAVIAASNLGQTTAPIFIGYQGNTEVLRVANDGKLGVGTNSPSSKIEITSDALGATQTNSSGLALVNNTAATVGAQQLSPGLRWRGNGWKTDATAASQTVDVMADVLPVQGAAAPYGEWRLRGSIAGGTYNTILTANTGGDLVVSNNVYAARIYSNIFRDAISGNTWVSLSGTSPTQVLAIGNSGIQTTHFQYGNVGIGTTSPGSPLQIDKTGSATEKFVTLNRPTAPTINNETKLAFALAGTDVGVMSSKREAASDYSLNFTTLQGGLANSVPGIHIGANNKVGINQDTAVYQLDVKGSSNHIRALSTSATATISLDNSTTGSSGGDIIQSGNNLLFSYPGYVDFSSTASSTKGITISEEGVFFLKNYNSTEATAITVANGQIIYVSSTGGVFTSVGFWGRENGAWVKL